MKNDTVKRRQLGRYRHNNEDTLYVLYNRYNKIVAISMEYYHVTTYVDQFPKSLEGSTIDTVTDKGKISKLMSKYIDDILLEEFKDDIILTAREVRFYTKELLSMYHDMKAMIGQLKLCESCIELSAEEIIKSKYIFNMYYSKCYSFRTFLDIVSSEYLMKHYIIEPCELVKVMTLDDAYREKRGGIEPTNLFQKYLDNHNK